MFKKICILVLLVLFLTGCTNSTNKDDTADLEVAVPPNETSGTTELTEESTDPPTTELIDEPAEQIESTEEKPTETEPPTTTEIPTTQRPTDPPTKEPPPTIPPQDTVIYGNTQGNINNGGYAAIQGDWIYYSTNIDYDYGSLYKIKTDGSEKTKVSDDNPSFINVVGDRIYYCNHTYVYGDVGFYSQYNIYSIKTDGSDRKQLNEDSSNAIIVVDDRIYYRNRDDTGYNVYSIKTDGSDRKKVTDVKEKSNGLGGIRSFVMGGDRIYYTVWYENGIHSVKTDGSDYKKVNDERSESFIVVDDLIYISNGQQIYSIKTDGSDRKHIINSTVNSNDTYNLNIVGDRIYYISYSWRLYSINIDGSDLKDITYAIPPHPYNYGTINVAGDRLYYSLSWIGGAAPEALELYTDFYTMKTDGSELIYVNKWGSTD